MTAIFLTIITLGVIVFFGISRSVSKFLPNNRLKHATVVGYALLVIGLVGLIIYHVEFLNTPALQINLESNFPDLLRAIAELLWPIAAILGIFSFLPQVLDFFNDPRKSVPWVKAFYGRTSTQDQQSFSDAVDIDKIPLHEELSDAHKELIDTYKLQLSKLPYGEQQARLLIHAVDCELRAIFEGVYNLIFGSQIQALQTLGTNPSIDLMPFYESHCERTENAKTVQLKSFDQWAQLLKDFGLVTESSNKYSLSSRGMLFLKFLKNRNYYLDKAF
jgi:hypothetical protein